MSESTPIRVAQMMTDMNYGGVEMVVMNYYRHIDRSKVQFDFFALEGSAVPQQEEIERLGGHVYLVPRYTHLVQYERAIMELFRKNQYQIVHSHMNTLGVFSLWGAQRAGVPNRIVHNHSVAGKGETKKNFVKYLLRPFAKIYPTQLCACSESAGRWLYGDSEFRVFNNAIDLEKFSFDAQKRAALRKELGLEGKFVVGHIGRFCYQKNHEFLLEVFAELQKLCPEAVLLLVGEGETQERIFQKAEQMGLKEKIHFIAQSKEPSKLYQAMDVFILPSRYEGLPVVGVEAQACALPLLYSTEISNEAKLLDSTRFMSLSESPRKWAEEALALAEQTPRRDTSKEMTEKGFNIAVEAKKLEVFYQSLLR